MTIDTASNDEALERALVQCLRLFAKHGRKIRHERLSPTEDRQNSETTEKETQDSGTRGSVQVHRPMEIDID